MKRSILVFLLVIAVLHGCKKSDTPSTAGTVTIDNTTYQESTYYVFGFSFSKAKKVSTLEDPGPDVIIYVNADNPPSRLTLQANNLAPSFYKVGDYADAESAINAFNDLKTIGNYPWTEMADPIGPNQVWAYRTGSGCYAKIRIISTVNETRNDLAYGECTFQWVYQPDGSETFPAR
jgi:hypothetical protein